MKYMKKLFGGLEMTWPCIIVSAVLIAAYTAVMLLIPAARRTSLCDIGGDIPCWIIFAMIIISNCKTAKEAAAKTFVFFLISQPLIYIFQAPFSELGLGLLRYYPPWALATVLTIPMAMIGWHTRKKGWLAPVILSSMLILLAVFAVNYFHTSLIFPPFHILSALACILFLVMLIYGILQERRQRILAWTVCAVTIAGSAVPIRQRQLCSGNLLLPEGVSYSDCAEVSVSDPSAGNAYLDDERQNVRVASKKMKDFEVTLTGKDGSMLGRYYVRTVADREYLAYIQDIRMIEQAQ